MPAASGADAAAASALLVRSEQLAAHAGLAPVAEAMVWAIVSLPVSSDGTGARAYERATLRIITALTTHAAHAGVVEGALWALVRRRRLEGCFSLSCLIPSPTSHALQYKYAVEPGAQQSAVASNANAVVLAALRMHGGHCGVVEVGCNLLSVLSCLPGAGGGSEPSIAALVSSLGAHGPGSALVATAACHALGNFTVGETGAAVAARGGAVPALLATLAAHRSDAGVAEGACLALRNVLSPAALAAAGADGPSVALRKDAALSVIEGLRVHRAAAAVVEQAAWALANVVAGTDAAAAALKADAIAAGAFAQLAGALDAHALTGTVVSACLVAVWSLATTEAARVAAALAGVIPAVVRGLLAHPATTRVSETGSQALWALCAANAANKAAAKREGAPGVLQTIKQRQGGTAAADAAAKALASLGDL